MISAIALAIAVISPFMASAQDGNEQDSDSKTCYKHRMGVMKIEQIGDDTMVVYINKKGHNYGNSNWGAFPFCGKKDKFNGHWAGIGLGWNGFVNSDFNMNFTGSESYLNMNTARSLMVNINPFELNLNLAGNKFGLVSGLGFSLHNYYFTDNYKLSDDTSYLAAYRLYDSEGKMVPTDINKLFVSYLTVPVLFEFQTNSKHRVNSFHVAAGVIGGVRLQTYQKMKLTSYEETLYLRNEQGTTVGSFNADEQKVRFKGPFYMAPFKLDATARIGWSYLNFWATYSLTPMFQKDKGPEVFPFSVGIQLIGW